MEQIALRLAASDGWRHLGGDAEARKPLEVVVRAFEGDVLLAAGAGPDAPEGEPVLVPQGEGRRIEGRHFFVRTAADAGSCLLSYRGI
jgi:hypothetical protein